MGRVPSPTILPMAGRARWAPAHPPSGAAIPGGPAVSPSRRRTPTAAAPTRGPSAPRPPGSMRVGRANSRPHREPQLLVGGVEEVVAEPEGDRPGHHGQLEVEQAGHRGHRPADEGAAAPAESEVGVGRRPAGRPPRWPCPTPRPPGSPARRTRRGVPRARRRRGRCGRRCHRRRRAADRRARCRRRRRSTPPWPGSRHSPGPRRPTPHRGPAPWHRCRRPPAARPGPPAGRAAETHARRGC